MRKIILVMVFLFSVFLFLSGCVPPPDACTDKETGATMSLDDARSAAAGSECAEKGMLKDKAMCNENTGTWWIDLSPFDENPLCNPACVIDVNSGTASVNWRCTGLVPE